MKAYWKIFLALCGGIFLAVFLTVGIYEANKTPHIQPSESSCIAEDITLTGYASRGSQKRFILKGKRLVLKARKAGPMIFGARDSLNIENPAVTFYENNLPVSSLSAESAQAAMARGGIPQTIVFYGKTVLITEDKRTLTCGRIAWDNKNNAIAAQGNCVLRYEGKVVRADGIDTGPALRYFEIKKRKAFLKKEGGK